MNEGAARVLEALREAGGGSCSGGAISERLGVSRAQVWKHVEALRERGYEIEGTPGGGYRLARRPIASTPRRSRPASRRAGSAARCSGSTRPTRPTASPASSRARARAHGLAVIAEGQTAGRGRLGRALLLAAALEPLHLDRAAPAHLARRARRPTILAAARPSRWPSASPTRSATPTRVEIKWPNDVLLGGRKTSGILMELVAEATRVGLLGARASAST